MADRITKANLDSLAKMINRVANTTEENAFYFSRANSGVKLVQTTAGGGERSILGIGYKPARVAYQMAYAYLTGLEDVWTKKVKIKDIT
jgi:hypothetical protein